MRSVRAKLGGYVPPENEKDVSDHIEKYLCRCCRIPMKGDQCEYCDIKGAAEDLKDVILGHLCVDVPTKI